MLIVVSVRASHDPGRGVKRTIAWSFPRPFNTNRCSKHIRSFVQALKSHPTKSERSKAILSGFAFWKVSALSVLIPRGFARTTKTTITYRLACRCFNISLLRGSGQVLVHLSLYSIIPGRCCIPKNSTHMRLGLILPITFLHVLTCC